MDTLYLTADEKAKVDPIIADFREKQKKLRDELLAKLKTVLNDKQYQQFESAFPHPPGPPPQGQGGDSNGPPPDQGGDGPRADQNRIDLGGLTCIRRPLEFPPTFAILPSADQAADGPREGNVPPVPEISGGLSTPSALLCGQWAIPKEVVVPTPISPVRPIPLHPNLDFDRKQAKVLLDAAHARATDALQRFNASHPLSVACEIQCCSDGPWHCMMRSS